MKPTEYKGPDAVALKCVQDYVVKDGTDDPETYEAGKTYNVSPRSAQHLLRKMRNVYSPLTADQKKKGQKRGDYQGDAPHFIDPKAEAEQAEADTHRKARATNRQIAAAAAKTKDGGPKSFDQMTVDELDAAAGEAKPEGWASMKKDEKIAALKKAAEGNDTPTGGN